MKWFYMQTGAMPPLLIAALAALYLRPGKRSPGGGRRRTAVLRREQQPCLLRPPADRPSGKRERRTTRKTTTEKSESSCKLLSQKSPRWRVRSPPSGATNRKDGFIEGNGYAVNLGLRPPGRAGNAPTVWHRGFPPGKPAYPAIIVHPPAPAGSGG